MFMIVVSAVSFALGLLSGLGLSTLLSLMLWFAFWLAVGVIACLALDACMGIGRKATALRVWIREKLRLRKRSHLVVVR
jgi:cytochrome bd-type quinol oxidase subunit 1